MNIYDNIARKKLLSDKWQSLLLLTVIALSTATLCTALSISINYLHAYFYQAPAIINTTLPKLLKSGLNNILELLGFFFNYLKFTGDYIAWEESSSYIIKAEPPIPPSTPASGILFSPKSSVENLPITILAALILVFFVVKTSISIVFSIYKNDRNRFFSILMLSGSRFEQINKCAVYEARYLCIAGIPFGIIISLIETVIIKPIAGFAFSNLTQNISCSEFPVNIKFSMIALIITVPIIYYNVLNYSKKECKNINIKTLASDTKNIMNVNIGMRVFSAKEKAYQRHGIEHYIAVRNYQSNLGKYAKITFITMVYVVLTSVSLITFNIVRSYNKPSVIKMSSEILGFTYSAQLYFCIVSAITVLLSIFCTFNSVFSNINANTNEYALMRSVCSSVTSVKRTVRIEGYISIVTGIVFSSLSVLGFFGFTEKFFGSDTSINLNGIKSTIITVGFEIIIFVLSVLVSSVLASRKMSKINTIGVLKNLSY